MFNRILIVCIGNICRSPLAEAIFKAYFKQKLYNIEVSSAGLAAMVNYPADPFSIEVGKSYGYDLSAHKAQQLTQEMMLANDLIIVMEDEHRLAIEKQYPFSKGKVHTLGKWRKIDIHDPYRKPKNAFEKMYANLYDCAQDWFLQFWP